MFVFAGVVLILVLVLVYALVQALLLQLPCFLPDFVAFRPAPTLAVSEALPPKRAGLFELCDFSDFFTTR